MKPRAPESAVPQKAAGVVQADESPSVSQFYTYRLHKLSALMSRQMHELLQERYDIGLAEWRTISVIENSGPVSVRDVARNGAMDKAQVSRLLPLLVERGIVKRNDHPTDRRRASLMLTEKGRTLFTEIHKIGVKRQAWLGDTLDADERAIFDECLNRLLTRVEKYPEGPFSQEAAA